MSTLTIEPHKAIDNHWYDQLELITAGLQAVFLLLEPSQEKLAAQKQAFFDTNCRQNPDLIPDTVNMAQLHDYHAHLQALLHDVAVENNVYIRNAYIGHIQERLQSIELVVGAAEGSRDYLDKNHALYGQPDGDIFIASCAWIRQQAEPHLSDTDNRLAEYADRVLRLIPDLAGNSDILWPRPDVFHAVRQAHFLPGGYFDCLFAPDGLPTEPYIDQLHGDVLTRHAIRNVGSTYSIKTATDGLWAVLTSSREVIRPAGYRVDRDYFTGVLAHEIGSHLLEEANGSRQPLQLLRVGLHGFEKGNEGRAYLREQIVYPDIEIFSQQSSWEYIIMCHLSVCLASGLHGKAYDFAQLYETLLALHNFWRQRRYPMDTNNSAEAAEEAWLLAVRIMKGTDGSGGCYMKDIVYLEGNIACWQLAERHGPEIIFQGDLGKFNIADPAHLRILHGLGIVSG